jgi:oligosaccharide repeat unit polymerase
MTEKNDCHFKKVLLLSFILINVCIIILSTIIVDVNSKNWIFFYVIVSLVQLSISIIYLKRAGEDLFSLSIIFIFFTYLFNFGQLFMYAFQIKNYSNYDVVGWIPTDILKNACLFTTVSIFFITLGIIIVWLKNKKAILICDEAENEKNLKHIFQIGLVLFCIGILPKFFLLFSQFRLYATGGYINTYNAVNFSGGGVLVTFSDMAEYGLAMILIGLQKNKRKCNFIFFGALLFELITMFTGNRSKAVMCILMFLFIYVKLIRKIKIKDMIIIIFCGYIGLSLLTFLSRVRTLIHIDFSTLFQQFIYSFFQHSPIFDALAEFGSTMLTLCYTISVYPRYVTHTYGVNYLLSFLVAIPNVGGILNRFRSAFEYITSNPFAVTYQHVALGGSFLGELYFNFNNFGAIFAIIIGFIVGIVSSNLHFAIKEKKWMKLSICMILFPSILWLVRNYFSGLIRGFVWTSIIIIIIGFFVNNKKNCLQSFKIKYNKIILYIEGFVMHKIRLIKNKWNN